MTEYTTQGISITTHTETCCEFPITSNIMHLYTGDERVDSCINCYESKEEWDDNVAHQLVDEGNMQYKRQWLRPIEDISGHDWTDRDGEYKLPIVTLQDGGVYEELWELDDKRQRAREVQCPWCNILTPKAFNDCQDCDRPLESNVR
jgi:acetone carboxylase gamma subunit